MVCLIPKPNSHLSTKRVQPYLIIPFISLKPWTNLYRSGKVAFVIERLPSAESTSTFHSPLPSVHSALVSLADYWKHVLNLLVDG